MIDPAELSVEEGYTLWAPLYDDDGNPLTALEGPLVQSWLAPIEGGRALDMGCGTGRHTALLVEAGAEVFAADRTAAMLARAREKLRGRPVTWLQSALPGPLPFEAGFFDLVVMGLIAEHLDRLDLALCEVGRLLRSGGRLILSAIHPERTRQGQRARFIDPETGVRRQISTYHREVEDYLNTARSLGFELIEERTLVVPRELAATLPRAVPYVGQPLGWAATWRR